VPGTVVLPAPPPPDGGGMSEAARKFQERLAQARDEYVQFSVYPPWSRPADGSQRHLWEWNRSPRQSHRQGRAADGKEIHVEPWLDRQFVGPGEGLTAGVTVWTESGDGGRAPIPFSARAEVRAWAGATSPGGKGRTVPVGGSHELRPVGNDSLTRHVTIVPSTITGLTSGNHDTEIVLFVAVGGGTQLYNLHFSHAAGRPFVVHGLAADAVVGGSLAVTLDVEAETSSPVLIQATLFGGEGAGTPIAIYDDYFRPPQAGRQTTTITFFGRALREAGLDGPYAIRALHGRVAGPGGATLWNSPAELRTGPHRATDFSGAEWRDPARGAKVDQYEQAIEGAAGSR
jgi:hypothetical protein